MLDWHSCQICYPLEIKILLLLLSFVTLAEEIGESGRASQFLIFWMKKLPL